MPFLSSSQLLESQINLNIQHQIVQQNAQQFGALVIAAIDKVAAQSTSCDQQLATNAAPLLLDTTTIQNDMQARYVEPALLVEKVEPSGSFQESENDDSDTTASPMKLEPIRKFEEELETGSVDEPRICMSVCFIKWTVHLNGLEKCRNVF